MGCTRKRSVEATNVVPPNSHADGAERVGGRVTDSVLAGVGRSNWREICTVRLYRIRRVYMRRSTDQIDR